MVVVRRVAVERAAVMVAVVGAAGRAVVVVRGVRALRVAATHAGKKSILIRCGAALCAESALRRFMVVVRRVAVERAAVMVAVIGAVDRAVVVVCGVRALRVAATHAGEKYRSRRGGLHGKQRGLPAAAREQCQTSQNGGKKQFSHNYLPFRASDSRIAWSPKDLPEPSIAYAYTEYKGEKRSESPVRRRTGDCFMSFPAS